MRFAYPVLSPEHVVVFLRGYLPRMNILSSSPIVI